MNNLNRCCIRAFVVLTALCCSDLAAQNAPGGTHAVNQDSVIIGTFEGNVKEYMKIHNQAKAGLPASKPSDSEHTINQRQRVMADRIRDARSAAKPGDVFTPEVSQLFKHLIKTTLQSPDGAKIRASMRRAEPVSAMPLRVSEVYPGHVPLQSSPPSLLLNLPKLPPELEYRIVGRDLVLRDVGANLIVDYIPSAIPS